MTKEYSSDLRMRVLRFVLSGQSQREASRHFEVSPSFVINLVSRHATTGSAAARKRDGTLAGKLDPFRDFLLERLDETLDATMPELAAELAERGPIVHPASISQFLLRSGLSQKSVLASQTLRADVRQSRQCWVEKRQPCMRLEMHRLVFIDCETDKQSIQRVDCPWNWMKTNMGRLRGHSPRGHRLKALLPVGHWKNETFVAARRS